mgnify:CR=1 FL=1
MRGRRLSLENRSDWLGELELVGADPGSWSRLSAKSSIMALKLFDLSSPMANILKQSMLSAGADALVTREAVTGRAPSSDALVVGTEKAIRRAAESLLGQPLGLAAVGETINSLLKRPALPKTMQLPGGTLDFSRRPLVMGVINVTPDSFSDGGLHLSPADALRRAEEMAEAGADLVDLGAESTRPGSSPVGAREQIDRLLPVLKGMEGLPEAPLISVDTSLPEVAESALRAGASIINDVTALSRPELAEIAAESGAGLVLMHMQGRPSNMQDDPRYRDVLTEVCDYLAGRVEIAKERGVPVQRIIVDPGIGFGKRLEHNIALIRRLDELHCLGCRVLLGHSRKSFLGAISGVDDPAARDIHTHAVTALVASDADLLRVHDAAGALEVLKIARALRGG